MKIPSAYRQDAPTAADPVAAPIWTKKPPKTKPKGEVAPKTHIKTPCDGCSGKFHAPLAVLKYRPSVQMWLCENCRDEVP